MPGPGVDARRETGRSTGRPALLIVLAALAALGMAALAPVAALAGGPVNVHWPSGCAGTLQQCITGVQDGSTVLIDTDTPVMERPKIMNKSLTLAAAPGHQPVVVDGLDVFASQGTHEVVIRGIRFNALIDVQLSGGTGHEVTFDRVRVVVDHSPSGAISNDGILAFSSVPGTVTVKRSRVSNRGSQGTGITVDAINGSGTFTFRAIANVISAHGNSNSGGGLELLARGPGGTVRFDIFNDVIWDVARCHCGGAVGLDVLTASSALAHAAVVGTTVDTVHEAGLVGDVREHGRLFLHVHNDVFAHTSGPAIFLGNTGDGLAFDASHNAYFKNHDPNHLGGRSLGTHNLQESPKFVDRASGDLRLGAGSPLIDEGVVCPQGGTANPDAAGLHRLKGRSVDIGAYERGAPAPDGIVFAGTTGPDSKTGTDAADVLCGYEGQDDFNGAGGPDYIDGGPGDDIMGGFGGADRMFGRGGADILCGVDGSGRDRLDGGKGHDGYDADHGDTLISLEYVFRPCHD